MIAGIPARFFMMGLPSEITLFNKSPMSSRSVAIEGKTSVIAKAGLLAKGG
jgi:hypothetical protein